MATIEYLYPAQIDIDEAGRFVVSFVDLPEALTDGANLDEALSEASDCLSEALASRIVDDEDIPAPTKCGVLTLQLARLEPPWIYQISPDPTIALKAGLYMRLKESDWTLADLARVLDIDWHQAARLIDPKRSSKLKTLQAALGALGCTITVAIGDVRDSADARQGSAGGQEPAVVFRGESRLEIGQDAPAPAVPLKSSA